MEMRGGHPGGARETYPDLTLFSEAKKPLFFYFFGFFGVAGRKERQSGNPHDICDIPYFENLRIFFENRKCISAPFFS